MRELDLLRYIYSRNNRLPESVTIPPGDDMAGLRLGSETVLITVDQLAVGVHVQPQTPIELIGRKALTRNLSDVAAMAARPTGAVCAASLPRDLDEPAARRLFDAMLETAERYRCPLVGGDVSFSDQPMLLSVTVFAEPAGVEPVLRSTARPGDLICVTGQLGGAWAAHASAADASESAGGQQAGSAGGQPAAHSRPHHLTFEPRIDTARRLATLPGTPLRSMIDLSDGLASDLTRICEQSGVAAELQIDQLPIRADAEQAADRDGRPAWLYALTDGEDYELCFTLDASAGDKILPDRIDGVPITTVGRILDRSENPTGSPVRLRHPDGRVEPLTHTGWEHHG